MKKTLLLLALASLSLTKLFAIVIYQPYSDVLVNSGSAICGNLSMEYKLPDSLKTGYTVSVSLQTSTNTQELYINYTFEAKEGATLNSNIVTDLNTFFWPINVAFTSEQTTWTQHVSVMVDENTMDANIIFWPYQKCYEISKKCEDVSYTEKEIRYATDCGTSPGYKLIARVNGDSLIIDSEDVPVLTVCLIQDFGIDSMSVTFKNLENKKYSVYKTETLVLAMPYYTNYSVSDGVISSVSFLELSGPIISDYTYKKFLGEADLSDCLVNGFEDNYATKTKIYPNPISESFSIEGFTGTINLTNQLGKGFTIAGNELFDASGLPKGIYIANFELDDVMHQEKIIIE